MRIDNVLLSIYCETERIRRKQQHSNRSVLMNNIDWRIEIDNRCPHLDKYVCVNTYEILIAIRKQTVGRRSYLTCLRLCSSNEINVFVCIYRATAQHEQNMN